MLLEWGWLTQRTIGIIQYVAGFLPSPFPLAATSSRTPSARNNNSELRGLLLCLVLVVVEYSHLSLTSTNDGIMNHLFGPGRFRSARDPRTYTALKPCSNLLVHYTATCLCRISLPRRRFFSHTTNKYHIMSSSSSPELTHPTIKGMHTSQHIKACN